jgi:FkbM family methyltransferase
MNLVQRIKRRLKRFANKPSAKSAPDKGAEKALVKARAEIARLREQAKGHAEAMAKSKRRGDNSRRRGVSDGILLMICAQLKPGDVVFDCGANVGKVTEVLAATGATVHAFEPDPHALTILRQKFADQPNVFLHGVAVGAVAGNVSFFRTPTLDNDPARAGEGNSIYGSHLAALKPSSEKIEVPMIDFPAFLADLLDKGAKVPFVKIDVEGAELEILPRLLADGLLDRIGLTAAETHEYQIADRAADFAALRQTIEARYPKHRVNLDWI